MKIHLILAQALTANGLQIAGHTVTTKTLAGWVLGLGFVYLCYKAKGVIAEAKKEHEAGERNEKVKYAIISVLAGLAILGLLDYTGIITFTEISSGMGSI